MKIAFLISFTLISTASCGQPGSIKEKQAQIDKFVEYLKNNDQQAIYDMCFHDKSCTNIFDNEYRIEQVRDAYKLIKKYGLPPKSKWHYIVANNYLVSYEVEIPLLTVPDNSSGINILYTSIMIIFPPEQISRMICNFKIYSETDHKKGLQAPGPPK
jgi:hypothetical protein